MKYEIEKYKIWNWKSPVVLHWILNPGVAFNELVLGQTIPRVMLIERERKKPFSQRSLVPCPHCGTMHSGLKWSSQNNTAFKNWFGYYCDNCKGIIPVQRNLTSFVLLTLTFPLWGWFRKSLKQKWLDVQADRFKSVNLEIEEKKLSSKSWLRSGFFFGIFMFVSMVLVYPLFKGETITLERVVIGLPLWLVGGLVWGFTMKRWIRRKGIDK